MEDALVRQQFYADGEASYQDTLQSNTVYSGADVNAYIMARVRKGKPDDKSGRPQAQPLDVDKPMTPADD